MPDVDGFQIVRRIREMFTSIGILRDSQPKIIAITSLVEPVYQEKAFKSGIDQVIPKPIPIDQFA